MQVDVVGLFATGVVFQVDFHLVAFADTDHWAGYGAIERPDAVLNARGNLDVLLDCLQVDHDVGTSAVDWRGDSRRCDELR